ncbi:MAG: amino acid ABC transporter permease [Proteobacteria bacterium]|nr:amino acid ABC transporter permease [Pseudomonadota bacterium]
MFATLIASLPYLLKGAVYTVALSAVTIVCGLVLGCVLGSVGHYGPGPVRKLVALYVFVLRGLPVLIVIFLFYYLPPVWGIDLDVYVAAGSALVCYSGAFVTEITRGAILAVPAAQTDAAKSLGLKTLPMLRLVVFPQALRFSAPPLLNNTIMSIKVTSYSSVVGVWELTFAAREVVERTLAAFEIFLGVMAIYFLLCFPLSVIAGRMERKFSAG